MLSPLPRRFYARSPEIVARELLGKLLVRKMGRDVLVGKIVETEAYLAAGDEAAHGFRGRSGRNQSLFKEAGLAYVHTMRQHALLDIVTEQESVPSSVLLRALEPVEGLERMKELRGTEILGNLASGPGKLCAALAITKEHDGIDVTKEDAAFFVAEGEQREEFDVAVSGRIGISRSVDAPLRFWISGSDYVSRK